MTLASLPDNQFNSKEINRVLLAEYERRKLHTDVDALPHKEALHTNKGYRNTKYDKASTMPETTKRTHTYYNCKKPGHFAKNCRAKTQNEYNAAQIKGKRNLDAFFVSLNNLDAKESWLLDSGCTHHVCKRRD